MRAGIVTVFTLNVHAQGTGDPPGFAFGESPLCQFRSRVRDVCDPGGFQGRDSQHNRDTQEPGPEQFDLP